MSALESKFSLYWRALKGPMLLSEVQFHPSRKWRFDFAHMGTKTAIEIEGGIYATAYRQNICRVCKQAKSGRHNSGRGFVADCEKYNEATILGWRIFRLTGAQIAAPMLERIISSINTSTSLQADKAITDGGLVALVKDDAAFQNPK
jgi:hypothetical protein